jgi:hypothetical protein
MPPVKPMPLTPPPTIAVDLRWFDDVQKFVKNIEDWFREPSNLPISPEEQARFIHSVAYSLHELTNTERHNRLKVARALLNYEGKPYAKAT